MSVPSIGWSEFAQKYSKSGTGNSFSILKPEQVIGLVQQNWGKRRPGAGESGIDRKVLVPVPAVNQANQTLFYCPPRAPLTVGMPLKARVVQRQEGEDPYIETYITAEDAARIGVEPVQAKRCDIVCYSAEALLENDGTRSTDCDWEIVTILCYPTDQEEPMPALTMARNFLEKAGGTKGVYSAQEFAESIYYHASQKTVKIVNESPAN